MLRAAPPAIASRPISPISGRGPPVLGSFLAGAAAGAASGAAAVGAAVVLAGAAPDAPDVGRAAGAAAAPLAGGAAAPLLARLAFTSFAVTTFGGLLVTIVADITSPVWNSERSDGLPERYSFTPRLSRSPCVKDLNPCGVCKTMLDPVTCLTVPFLTSVTVTGVTVVLVVIVAVPAIPGFSSCTDSCFPSTVNLKSSGTVS